MNIPARPTKRTMPSYPIIIIVTLIVVLLSSLTVVHSPYALSASTNFNLHAQRFHADISCKDFEQRVRSSGGSYTTTMTTSDKHTYEIKPSWLVIFGDNGQDFYKNNCLNNNAVPNVQLKNGGNLELDYNVPHFESTSIYLANNTDSDEHIMTSNKQQLYTQLEKLTTNNVNGIENFGFKVANKADIYKLVIVEGINDEAVGYYIIKDVKVS
jgi:hypothetical protein